MRLSAGDVEDVEPFDSRDDWPAGTDVLVELPAAPTVSADGRLYVAGVRNVVGGKLMTRVRPHDAVVAVRVGRGWRLVRRGQVLGVVLS